MEKIIFLTILSLAAGGVKGYGISYKIITPFTASGTPTMTAAVRERSTITTPITKSISYKTKTPFTASGTSTMTAAKREPLTTKAQIATIISSTTETQFTSSSIPSITTAGRDPSTSTTQIEEVIKKKKNCRHLWQTVCNENGCEGELVINCE